MTGAPCGHSVEGSWHYLINLISPSLINSISASSHSPLGPPICPPSSPRHSGISQRACRLCNCTHTINIRPSCPFLRNLLLPLFSPFRVQPLSILTHTHGRPERSKHSHSDPVSDHRVWAQNRPRTLGRGHRHSRRLVLSSLAHNPIILVQYYHSHPRRPWINISLIIVSSCGWPFWISLPQSFTTPDLSFWYLHVALAPVVTNQLNPDTSARLSPLTCGHRMHTNIPASTHTTAHEHRLQP